jgi:hypothetical protein
MKQASVSSATGRESAGRHGTGTSGRFCGMQGRSLVCRECPFATLHEAINVRDAAVRRFSPGHGRPNLRPRGWSTPMISELRP